MPQTPPDAEPLPPGFHAVPQGHLAAVVTHLEMTAPPPRAPRPGPEGPTLERLTDPDPAAYRHLFRAVGEDWLWFSRLRLEDAALRETLSDPAVEAYEVRQEGRPAGLLELDFRPAPRPELAFFGLVAGAAGQGLGRWLMDEALARAWAPGRGTEVLTVHTCTLDSPAALPFYLRSGFIAVRREVEIAPDPRLDGSLPATAAPQVPVIR